MSNPLTNRVANSNLVVINLENWYPSQPIVAFDIKDYLFQGLILREKEFREALTKLHHEDYRDKLVHVFCSTDAIIPTWAYMLVASHLESVCAEFFYGDREALLTQYYRRHIAELDVSSYAGQRLVLKGCSDKDVPKSAYMELTGRLRSVARSIMFGEPCSTVPIYKQKPKSIVIES